MTLMDAPKYDVARARRRLQTVYAFLAGFVILIVAAWFIVGRPIDYPWTWVTYWTGQRTTQQFLVAVENNNLPKAYGIWVDDPEWQHHPEKFKTYNFDRFQADWGPNSTANDYGAFTSHKVVVTKLWGNSLIVGSMINGRKSKPLFLAYDPKGHTLGFSPVELTID
ncbi:hypothetical protein [Acidicapsa ligni]|uniref:hypothetical protein n=1 Tax=Acidicapsa ligni TaxID=542300 RepID=UPI0021DFC845|nr:hypothetical protein [Acidicapsa ligni]